MAQWFDEDIVNLVIKIQSRDLLSRERVEEMDTVLEDFGSEEGDAMMVAIAEVLNQRINPLLVAAKNLRQAQRNYMANRGNQDYGRLVVEAAGALDVVIKQVEEYSNDNTSLRNEASDGNGGEAVRESG